MSWNATFVTSRARKMKKALDKGGNICTIFIYLSKAFDTINHGLLLAKLNSYAFSENAVKLMCSYLKNLRQVVQINKMSFHIRKLKLVFHKALLMFHFCLTYL